MTIYTSDAQLGVVSSTGVFTVGTRYGADGDIAPYTPQIVTPVYNRKFEFTFSNATCTVTPVANTWDWRVQANVGTSGWFRGWMTFKATVNSGSYGNNHIDAEVTCYAGSDAAELINVHDSNPSDFSGPDPTLSEAGSDDPIAIGETRWLEGSGALTYQTGYFSVMVAGTYHSGITVDAYFRLNRLRWGSVIIWDTNSKGLHTSNVKYG